MNRNSGALSQRSSSSTPSLLSPASAATASPSTGPRSPSAYQPLSSVSASTMAHSSRSNYPIAESHTAHRSPESGNHLWSDGMKGLLTSLTGAPNPKDRSHAAPMAKAYEPARTSDVEAATSIWSVPRETVAMTMGYQDSYDNPNFPPPVWPASNVHGYAPGSQSHDNNLASYGSTPSGMAGDASRPRADTGDRQTIRRPMYARPTADGEVVTDSHATPWWPSADHPSSLEDTHPHYAAAHRRPNPPPLPETRSANRPAWGGPSGLDMGGYEFPPNNLGKREYENDTFEAPQHGIADDSRRYSLTPGMSFSRPSAPISGMMNSYRPSFPNDPRRPSLPSDGYGMPQQGFHGGARPYGGNPSQWSQWGSSSSPTYPSGMSMPATSPNPQAWRDNRYPENPASSGMAGPSASKKHQRGRSSSAASALQQANTLANTPFHITTEIVLRASPGSKMEDVFYDQHCEVQTGLPDPPASDFELDNEDDRPRLQTDKLRFPGDLYTPRWVRGAGNAREAWCDRCENGNWLQLKNSQYWYDQVHKHGVSSVSGLRFTAPTHLKIYSDAAGTIEGKCHHCKEWVLICTAKRRRNFSAFFKHAHACHSYRKASAIGNGPIVEHNPGGYRNNKKE